MRSELHRVSLVKSLCQPGSAFTWGQAHFSVHVYIFGFLTCLAAHCNQLTHSNCTGSQFSQSLTLHLSGRVVRGCSCTAGPGWETLGQAGPQSSHVHPVCLMYLFIDDAYDIYIYIHVCVCVIYGYIYIYYIFDVHTSIRFCVFVHMNHVYACIHFPLGNMLLLDAG